MKFPFGTGAVGRQRIDLVKSFNTKARIYAVIWVLSPTSVFTTDFNFLAAISTLDYESSNITVTAPLLMADRRIISVYQVVNEITTEGQTMIMPVLKDILRKPVDIVCPITVLQVTGGASSGYYGLIDYEIMSATKEEIIKLAADQGLNLEV